MCTRIFVYVIQTFASLPTLIEWVNFIQFSETHLNFIHFFLHRERLIYQISPRIWHFIQMVNDDGVSHSNNPHQNMRTSMIHLHCNVATFILGPIILHRASSTENRASSVEHTGNQHRILPLYQNVIIKTFSDAI